jgi:hypothetical protein
VVIYHVLKLDLVLLEFLFYIKIILGNLKVQTHRTRFDNAT